MYDKRSKVGWGVVCAGALVQCNRWQQRRGTDPHYFFVQGRNLGEFEY